MMTVVKPSPLRLWGFVLTVAGGALLAFGSISDWAAVSLGGSAEAAVPTKGIDLWQGKVTLALGALILVGRDELVVIRLGQMRLRHPLGRGLEDAVLLQYGLDRRGHAMCSSRGLPARARPAGLRRPASAHGV